MTKSTARTSALPTRTEVAVVGGGYAGLAAALALHDNGVECLVLEGSDRVGGRVCSERRDDTVVLDHGGQWVGPTQKRLLALAERFGCAMFPTYNTGEHLDLWHDGTKRRYDGAGPDGGPGMAGYSALTDRIDEMAHVIDLDDPAATPGLAELDSETVESYLLRTVDDEDARRRFALAVQGVWSTEPQRISVFHLLFYVASAGGFEQLMETEGCAQERRFLDGAQAPARAVAAYLGERVALDTAVRTIEHTADGVRIETSRGALLADRVVVATPPAATLGVRFAPALPVARNRWIERSPMGDVAKMHVVFETPFWRADGLSGQATVFGDRHVGVVFDNSPRDADRGILVCFVYGDRLRSWSELSDEDRRAGIIDTLIELFGERAANPIDYTEKIWPQDAWAHGGYAANPTPGTWLEHGAAGWRSRTGRIHWAGSETAGVWNGYIDGAISSGARAADEIMLARRA